MNYKKSKKKFLQRRTVKKKKIVKPPAYIIPQKKIKGTSYVQSADYKYFEGHVVLEIAKKLSPKLVVCWYNDHILSLPACAYRKFWKQDSCCKRCSLFQNDEPAQELRDLVVGWEDDDFEGVN